MDKDAVRKHIHAALEREGRINLHRHPVRIESADGTVTLEGEVGDVAAKKLALELAASVRGVRGVVDRLRVDPGERRGDGAVRAALGRLFLQQPELRRCGVSLRNNGKVDLLRRVDNDADGELELSVSDGVVLLEGHVISQSHLRFAGALAWWTPGRRDVINALEVRPAYEDRDDEVVEVMRLVLEADPELDADQIRPNCANKVITLEGSVPSEREKRRAELDAWSMFAVKGVVNRLRVSG